MKVSFLTKTLEKGALLNVNSSLAKRVKERGGEVEFVSIERPDIVKLPLHVKECSIVNLDLVRVREYLFGFYRYLKITDSNVIFISGYLSSILMIVASCFVQGSPRIVVHVHEMTSKYLSSRKGLVERYLAVPLMKLFFRRASEVVSVSNAVARDLEELLSWKSPRICTLYNGIDVPEVLRKSKGASPFSRFIDNIDVPIILGVGRLEPEKRFEDLIYAFSRLVKKKDAALIFLGEGSKQKDLNILAEKLSVGDRVHFLGYVENPYQCMSLADLLVVTSEREGLCNVVIEALACGCPVISTKCGGPEEVLSFSDQTWLVDVGDIEALSSSMLRLLAQPADWKVLRNRARDFDLKNKVYPRFDQILDRVL